MASEISGIIYPLTIGLYKKCQRIKAGMIHEIGSYGKIAYPERFPRLRDLGIYLGRFIVYEYIGYFDQRLDAAAHPKRNNRVGIFEQAIVVPVGVRDQNSVYAFRFVSIKAFYIGQDFQLLKVILRKLDHKRRALRYLK